MIKIIFPDGRTEFHDVRKLTQTDVQLIFDGWGTLKFAYSVRGNNGRETLFYIISKDTEELPEEERPIFNRPVYDAYGVKVWGTAILCREDVIDD